MTSHALGLPSASVGVGLGKMLATMCKTVHSTEERNTLVECTMVAIPINKVVCETKVCASKPSLSDKTCGSMALIPY